MLTYDRLRELLEYNPETGIFTWRVRRNCRAGCVMPGDVAGYINPEGYCVINTHGRPQRAHRLAWLYVYGEWPPGKLDHKNRRRSDNRIANLRAATNSQNSANGPRRNPASGYKGVYQSKGQRRWFAQISVNSRSKSLGCFDTPEEAHAAYMAAARTHYGEFARIE